MVVVHLGAAMGGPENNWRSALRQIKEFPEILGQGVVTKVQAWPCQHLSVARFDFFYLNLLLQSSRCFNFSIQNSELSKPSYFIE